MKKYIPLLLIVPAFISADSGKQGWLGVLSKDIDEPLKIALCIEDGVMVSKVVEGSPAEKAGFKKGDIIIEVDGEKIEDGDDLRYIVRKRPNKQVAISVVRRGKPLTLQARLSEREKDALNIDIGPFHLNIEDLKLEKKHASEEMEKEFSRLNEELDSLREELKVLKKQLEEKVQSK